MAARKNEYGRSSAQCLSANDSRLINVFGACFGKPLKERYHRRPCATQGPCRCSFEDDGKRIARILGRPIPNHPRIHPLIAHAKLRGSRFSGNAYTGKIERLHRRISSVRCDREAHSLSHDAQVLIWYFYVSKCRCGACDQSRCGQVSAICNRGDVSHRLHGRNLESKLSDDRVIRVAQAPRIIFTKYFNFPLGCRDDTSALSRERNTGRLAESKATRILIDLFNAKPHLSAISAADRVKVFVGGYGTQVGLGIEK